MQIFNNKESNNEIILESRYNLSIRGLRDRFSLQHLCYLICITINIEFILEILSVISALKRLRLSKFG